MPETIKKWLDYQTSYACRTPVEVAPCELAFRIVAPAALLLAAGAFAAAMIVEYATARLPQENGPYHTR